MKKEKKKARKLVELSRRREKIRKRKNEEVGGGVKKVEKSQKIKKKGKEEADGVDNTKAMGSTEVKNLQSYH